MTQYISIPRDSLPAQHDFLVRPLGSGDQDPLEQVKPFHEGEVKKKFIFKEIRKCICLVKSTFSHSTGFFVKLYDRAYLLTTSHTIVKSDELNFRNEKDKKYDQIFSEIRDQIINNAIRIESPYGSFIGKVTRISCSEDIALLECFSTQETYVPCYQLHTSLPMEIYEGSSIYFSGYPLGKGVLSHKGRISSNTKSSDTFSIDGTVVTGHSGSPVFGYEEKKMYLIGMVTRQAINDPEDFLRQYSTSSNSEVEEDKFSLPQSQKEDMVSKLLHFLRENASTGIGVGVFIQNIPDMLFDDSYNPSSSKFSIEPREQYEDLEVKGSKKKSLKKEKPKTQYKDHDVYHDNHGWKHVVSEKTYRVHLEGNKRTLAKSTIGNDSKFLPAFGNQYEKMIETCVKKWVDSGANFRYPYVEFEKDVGADDGNLTKHVKIYFTSSGGAHIRPKFNPKQKTT